MNHRYLAWGSCLQLCFALLLAGGYGQDSTTIDKGTSAPSRLRATILLQDSGRKLKELTTDEMFYSGERFRLRLRSDRDGYLYVLLSDSQGQAQLIYPNSQDLRYRHNRIARNETQSVPSREFFRFDENPGTERVWVIVSPWPLAHLDRAARSGGEVDRSMLNSYVNGAYIEDRSDTKGIDRDPDRDVDRTNDTAVLPLRIVHLPR